MPHLYTDLIAIFNIEIMEDEFNAVEAIASTNILNNK